MLFQDSLELEITKKKHLKKQFEPFDISMEPDQLELDRLKQAQPKLNETEVIML